MAGQHINLGVELLTYKFYRASDDDDNNNSIGFSITPEHTDVLLVNAERADVNLRHVRGSHQISRLPVDNNRKDNPKSAK